MLFSFKSWLSWHSYTHNFTMIIFKKQCMKLCKSWELEVSITIYFLMLYWEKGYCSIPSYSSIFWIAYLLICIFTKWFKSKPYGIKSSIIFIILWYFRKCYKKFGIIFYPNYISFISPKFSIIVINKRF